MIFDKNNPLTLEDKLYFKSIFDELHLSIIYQGEPFVQDLNLNLEFLSSSKSSGSPHALLMGETMYIEVESLLIDIKDVTVNSGAHAAFNFSNITSLS